MGEQTLQGEFWKGRRNCVGKSPKDLAQRRSGQQRVLSSSATPRDTQEQGSRLPGSSCLTKAPNGSNSLQVTLKTSPALFEGKQQTQTLHTVSAEQNTTS